MLIVLITSRKFHRDPFCFLAKRKEIPMVRDGSLDEQVKTLLQRMLRGHKNEKRVATEPTASSLHGLKLKKPSSDYMTSDVSAGHMLS